MGKESEMAGGTDRHNLNLPENYQSFLDLRETEKAIKLIKDHFQITFLENEISASSLAMAAPESIISVANSTPVLMPGTLPAT